MKIFRFISDIFNVSVEVGSIKNDEQRRPKSARFAVTCIAYSLLTAAFAGVAGWLFKTFIDLDEITDIVAIVFAGILGLSALACLVGAVVRLIAQFTINRSVWSWIALCVFAASVVAAVVIVLVL